MTRISTVESSAKRASHKQPLCIPAWQNLQPVTAWMIVVVSSLHIRPIKIMAIYDLDDTGMLQAITCLVISIICSTSLLAVFFFFLFTHYSRATYQIMARLCTVRFLSAVRAVAARCKRPFALRPGLSQEGMKRTKGIRKERTSEMDK